MSEGGSLGGTVFLNTEADAMHWPVTVQAQSQNGGWVNDNR